MNEKTISISISETSIYFTFTEEDYDQFCLAYMFTYRDFEMGTLGLAWTGDLKNAGGVCEKNGVSVASLVSLKTNFMYEIMKLPNNVLNERTFIRFIDGTFNSFGVPNSKRADRRNEKRNLSRLSQYFIW